MHIALLENKILPINTINHLLQKAGYQVTAFTGISEFNHYCINSCIKSGKTRLKVDLLVFMPTSMTTIDKLLRSEFVRPKAMGLVILSHLDCVESRINTLNAGADACLSKPIDIRELIAVIESVMRRITQSLSDPLEHHNDRWQLDVAKRNLIKPDGSVIQLTCAEGIVLHALAQQAPQPVSRQHLSASLGQDHHYYDERKLEAIVSRLRRKINLGNHDNQLKAARGRGYQLLIDVFTQ